jgi:hypothetical protein
MGARKGGDGTNDSLPSQGRARVGSKTKLMKLEIKSNIHTLHSSSFITHNECSFTKCELG